MSHCKKYVGIEVGDKFANWPELRDTMEKVQNETQVLLYMRDSITLKGAVRKRPRVASMANPDLIYHSIHYICVFGGRQMVREPRCKSEIKIGLSDDFQCLEVRRIIDIHNHVFSLAIFNKLKEKKGTSHTPRYRASACKITQPITTSTRKRRRKRYSSYDYSDVYSDDENDIDNNRAKLTPKRQSKISPVHSKSQRRRNAKKSIEIDLEELCAEMGKVEEMAVSKRCSHGTCDSDARNPERCVGVTFFPFPNPENYPEACLRWILACRRPHHELNLDILEKGCYVCSKHFVAGKPTRHHPVPIVAGTFELWDNGELGQPESDETSNRSSNSITDYGGDQFIDVDIHSDIGSDKYDSDSVEIKKESLSPFATNNGNNCRDNKMQKTTVGSRDSIKPTKGKTEDLNRQLQLLQKKCDKNTVLLDQINTLVFGVQAVLNSPIENLLLFYTGLEPEQFKALFSFLIPNPDDNPLKNGKDKSGCTEISLEDQLFLVLCRLRNAFDVKDLAFRFKISTKSTSCIFSSWIKYMHLKLSHLSFWPDRNTILSNLTDKFKRNFPSTLAIVESTEIRTEIPLPSETDDCPSNSLDQSANKLKAMVVTDPRGSVMFTSRLFNTSVPETEMCERSGFFKHLRHLLEENLIQPGDTVMAAISFDIKDVLYLLGVNLIALPMPTLNRGKLSTHSTRIAQSINRIKEFEILQRCIPESLFESVNEIWMVCCYLTNFMDVLE